MTADTAASDGGGHGAASADQTMSMGTATYTPGANLGGWLVMENWLFPNVLLLRMGSKGIVDNSELDYLLRMRERGIDDVGSMHDHYNQFLGVGPNGEGLLEATAPPPRLAALAAAGVKSVRIPIGYWSLEAPTQEVRVLGGDFAHDYERPGVTSEGFVTGAATYLRAACRWLRVLNMTAVVDMHSLPGGAVRNMGYTGRYFPSAEAFEGADAWARNANSSSSSFVRSSSTSSSASVFSSRS